MIEKILFAIIAFILFITLFFKMIQKNDANYVYLLLVQTIGIIIQFIALLIDLKIPIICDADIGHVSPQLAIVNGAILKITSENGKGKVETYLK